MHSPVRGCALRVRQRVNAFSGTNGVRPKYSLLPYTRECTGRVRMLVGERRSNAPNRKIRVPEFILARERLSIFIISNQLCNVAINVPR